MPLQSAEMEKRESQIRQMMMISNVIEILPAEVEMKEEIGISNGY